MFAVVERGAKTVVPHGVTFAARYERISRKNSPGNIRVTRTRTIGPRKNVLKRKQQDSL